MMAAILNSTMLDLDTAILDSDTFLSSLRFTPKHSPSTLTLTQTNSIWLTRWWQPSWILSSWIQPFCTKLCLKLIQSDSTSFILTQLDDDSHLEFCHLEFSHLGFSYLSFSSQTHSHLPGLVPTICTKKPSLIHSDSTWWWQPSCILTCWIQTPCFLLSDSLKNTLTPLWLWLKVIQSDSNSFILTQLDDGSHLEFCHLEFGHLGFSHLSFSSQTRSHFPTLGPTICTKKTFTHSFWLNLMMAAILNSTMLDSDSAILDSDNFLSSLRFTQKHSPSTLTLTQTKSIWLTWWWQPSWILPSWILPSWIQPFCAKLWLKLIQSDSNSFILTQHDDGGHLEFCHLEFGHLGFSHLSFSSQTHSHLPRLVPTICTKKTFTHSYWLNLMMASILNSTMLDSDSAILDSDTLFSSLRFTQKHSHSTLTLDSN